MVLIVVALATGDARAEVAGTGGGSAIGAATEKTSHAVVKDSAARAGKLVVTPRRLDSIRIGMGLQDALATGYFIADPTEQCGDLAHLVPRYERDIFVDWKDDVIFSFLIKGPQARTRDRVGVGTAVRTLRRVQSRLRGPRQVDGDGGALWIQTTRRGQNWLIFGLSTPADRRPRAKDEVEFMYVQSGWSTKQGLYGGC
ncbi:hypothetical protein Pve01_94530 [Planomonospora venezuelensis]|nr:hypothetical protein Pve01_94530 [Planomonospora venezuelensis]